MAADPLPFPTPTAELVKQSGEGRIFRTQECETIVVVDAPDPSQRSFAVMESRLPAGWYGPPKHFHVLFDEFWFVIEGRIEFEVNNDRHWVSEGGSVFAPRGTPHHVHGPGGSRARMLTTCTSAQLQMVEGFDPRKATAQMIVEYMRRYDTYLVD